MAKDLIGINPNILRWARERAGFSLDEVAAALKKDIEVIKGWESGKPAPNYPQLEKLAYQLYKRPIAIFFFPEPPDEPDPKQSFRTLPEFEIENLAPDSRYALRQAELMHIYLKELNAGTNPAEKKIFLDISYTPSTSTEALAREVREYLDISLATQLQWDTTEEALKHWRNALERHGIFVFKRSFKQRDISGFCLLDPEFPIIYVNNSTAKSRQIFTLFHELAHILTSSNGITKTDDTYITALKGSARSIEVFCNQFANEFLVPDLDFKAQLTRSSWDDAAISELANRYLVSREVVARKLLDRNLIDKQYYDRKRVEWAREYAERERPPGGNYYATQATYLGDNYLNLAFGKFYQGSCTIDQLADYLNVKVKSIPGLEQFVLGKAEP